MTKCTLKQSSIVELKVVSKSFTFGPFDKIYEANIYIIYCPNTFDLKQPEEKIVYNYMMAYNIISQIIRETFITTKQRKQRTDPSLT